MNAERVRKMMFLRLHSGRINEAKYVNAGLDGIRVVREEVWGQATAAQEKGAMEVVALDCSGWP